MTIRSQTSPAVQGPWSTSNNVHYHCDNIVKYYVTLYDGQMYLEK